MRLLLIEDDPMIGEAALALLRGDGYAVDWVKDGAHADGVLRGQAYDLVVLDLGLPGLDGLELLRRLRARDQRVPVLVTTARDTVGDRVAGLDAGADDYLLKPYAIDEMLARIRALLRRGTGAGSPLWRYGDVVIDRQARQASRAGQPVALSAREWGVLDALLQRPGAVLSRAQLEEKLYSWQTDVASNAVEVFIHGLRRKLGADIVRNLRGVGYCAPRAES